MSFRSIRQLFGRWGSSILRFVVIGSFFAPAQTLNYEEQITANEGRLAKARAAHNEKEEPYELVGLGELQAHDGLAKIALETENNALALCIRLKLGKPAGVAVQDIGCGSVPCSKTRNSPSSITIRALRCKKPSPTYENSPFGELFRVNHAELVIGE